MKPLLLACTALLAGNALAAVTQVVSTADLSETLATKPAPKFTASAAPDQPVISVDARVKFQKILGFGGTFSEATAYNLKRLNAEKRQELLEAFFSPTRGAGWTLLRTTINSCDASSKHYAYANVPGDTNLTHFSIQEDVDNFMIPGLKAALAVPGADFKIFAAPWTPPVWMKDSGVFNKGSLKPEFYAAWALYFSKYITAYREHGIPIWEVSPQNEPAAAQQAWDACGWTPEQMRVFVRDHLGPRLRRDHPQVGLQAWDHNKNLLLKWCDVLLGDPECAKYFTSIAHHWYEEGEGKFFEPLVEAHRKYPNLPLLATEQGVFGLFLLKPEPAELYARDLIGNMNNWSQAWVVWGMAFDHRGGPNHAKNFNHSPIMVDVETGVLHYNPSYYYLAHFSKYVRPGATRIGITQVPGDLHATAFQNADGKQVVVLLNTTATDRKLTVRDEAANRNLPFELKARSIVTLMF